MIYFQALLRKSGFKILLLLLEVPQKICLNSWPLQDLLWRWTKVLWTSAFPKLGQTVKTMPLVQHWRPFTLMFFKKRFDMLSRCILPSIIKKVIFYSLVLGQQTLIVLQIQNYYKKHLKSTWKVFQCSLKPIKTFLIQNYFYSNAKQKYK